MDILHKFSRVTLAYPLRGKPVEVTSKFSKQILSLFPLAAISLDYKLGTTLCNESVQKDYSGRGYCLSASNGVSVGIVTITWSFDVPDAEITASDVIGLPVMSIETVEKTVLRNSVI